MKTDLKQRLTGRIFKVTVSFLIGIISCAQAQITDPSKDSIRRVEVRVVAKEKVINYDSIFRESRAAVNSVKVQKTIQPSTRAGRSRTSTHAPLKEIETPIKTIPKEKPVTTAENRQKVPPMAAEVPKADPAVSVPKTTPAAGGTAAHSETIKNLPSFQQPGDSAEYGRQGPSSANKISYLWIGFVLVIGGIVLGLIFGRTAFMVSVVGIVFLIIGFFVGQ